MQRPRRTKNCQRDILDLQRHNPSHRNHGNCCEKRYFYGMDATHVAGHEADPLAKFSRSTKCHESLNIDEKSRPFMYHESKPKVQVQAIKEYAQESNQMQLSWGQKLAKLECLCAIAPVCERNDDVEESERRTLKVEKIGAGPPCDGGCDRNGRSQPRDGW